MRARRDGTYDDAAVEVLPGRMLDHPKRPFLPRLVRSGARNDSFRGGAASEIMAGRADFYAVVQSARARAGFVEIRLLFASNVFLFANRMRLDWIVDRSSVDHRSCDNLRSRSGRPRGSCTHLRPLENILPPHGFLGLADLSLQEYVPFLKDFLAFNSKGILQG